MSEENVDLVRRLVKAFNEVGWVEAAITCCHPDFVFEEPPEQPSPSVARGREAAIRMFAQFEEVWEDHRSEIEEIRVIDEERALTLTIEHFQGRDGLAISQKCGTIFTIRDGNIIRMQVFWDRENAFEAAGLAE